MATVQLIAFLLAISMVQSRMFDIVRQDLAEDDWTYLLFTVHWPVTTCLIWKERPGNTCVLPENHVWTVHGIWPSQQGAEGPFFCNRTWVFNPDKLQELRPQLLKFWPNIHGNDTEDSLWKHEWDKHGTCAALDPKFGSEPLYFNKGIEWVRNYHMADILAKNNIIPSMSTMYNVTVIEKTLKSSIGAVPTVGCEFDKETGLTYLSEIRLCFLRDLSLVDCKHNHSVRRKGFSSVNDCPTHKLISYPGIASLSNKSSKLYRKTKERKKISAN